MTLGELVMNGGWAMYPIYACSVLAVAIFLKKLLEFHATQLGHTDWFELVVQQLHANEFDEAQKVCATTRHPASRIVCAMLQTYERRPDRVEAEAGRVGSLELQQLEKHVGVLSFIAQVAPLLGLLGTVIGMVQLFMGLQGAGMASVDAAMLSSGIWKALLTTAAGLLVAVPALAGYTYLTSRTDAVRLVFRDIIVQVQNALPETHERPGDRQSTAMVREVADAI